MATLTKKNSEEEKKAFVLDTNVILHDHKCVYMFAEHDVVILTVVLEELDKFKKGNEEINFHARKFINIMDKFRLHRINKPGDKNNNFQMKNVSALYNRGAQIGEGKGYIQTKISGKVPQNITSVFPTSTADNQILGTVLEMQKDSREKRKIVLVTKDVNLRIKADALGIDVEDYENDKVSASDMYLGRATIENCPVELITSLYEGKDVDMDQFQKIHRENCYANMYFIIRNKKHSALSRFDSASQTLIRVEKKVVSGITPLNSEQVFAVDALMNETIQLLSISGLAGTGKTLLAMAAALAQLRDKKYDQIIISSATVPLGNKEIGFLPGDERDKVSPYMGGIFDNLEFIKSQIGRKEVKWVEDIQNQQKEGKIKIQPLSSIRGRSINNTFMVIDETQNLTPHEVKTIITRAGKNTKVVFCGDVMQIDNPYVDTYSNGLAYVLAKMKNQLLYAHITLEKGERSELAELAARLMN